MKLIAKSGRIGRGVILTVLVLALSITAACDGGGGDHGLPEDTVLTLNWTGFDGDMFNTIIYVRLQAVSDGYKIGPYEAFILENGTAIVGINEAYDTSEEWVISYWVDVNKNQTAEEDPDDILRQRALTLGATSVTLNHTTDSAPAGMTDYPGPLSGFANYDPRP
ncbi:MAG: hypothetical protein HN929_10675 [Chloroflexi bacterium]|nr:hypothetical protein [Chloroflexota bacterium]MBT7081908.1 hypothetical protein [Chloroflexota bacterium]MBT7289821.1 hypothetical protein [Chloroflexota bacterium]